MIGVDEVGRGCWAGPLLVVAARQTGKLPDGLKDSKLLSRNQRESIYQLLSTSCQFGEGWVKAAEIDTYGLSRALKLGVKRALGDLKAEVDEEIIMDGSVNYSPKKFINSKCLVGGDNLLPIISAASVYAKVTRDNFMARVAIKYPNYSFDKHVGYGTAGHQLALKTYGAIQNVHRYSFTPIARLALPKGEPA